MTKLSDQEPSPFETLRPAQQSGGDKPVHQPPALPDSGSWWDSYLASIARIPDNTRMVLEDDARYIAGRALPQLDGELDTQAFGSDRIRTGIVVGSVQSGKTASMLAVAALLLDRNVDILIILAGTRVALWLQTYERLLAQLDGTDIGSAWTRNGLRVITPQPEDVLSSNGRVDPTRYLKGNRLRVRSALRDGRPTIFVVQKEDDHLLALGRFLANETGIVLEGGRIRPITCVVLDDEADDASILDAREGSKITPRFIQLLWASESSAPATRDQLLFATYIAYTATPQANYLQQSHNPLAPRNFHASLRVPADRGARTPRTATFTEQMGLSAYYCGGEVYYEWLRGLPGDFCYSLPFPTQAPGEASECAEARHTQTRWRLIGEAMRSFLVAGAIRLYQQDKRLSDVPSAPSSIELLRRVIPETHSMLYHPSALKEAHFLGAADLVRWSKSLPGEEDQVELPTDEYGDPVLELDASGLARRLDAEESDWRSWLPKFASTAMGLASFPGSRTDRIGTYDWQIIRRLLIEEIFVYTKIRVLNSDPRADDRPGFDVTRKGASGDAWSPPQDICTIFVAGNVLSRGLTIEGLCTSLFLRGAKEPAADTQMQMQRWFGYRGRHLPFCRVFLFDDQLELFRHYHRNDIALKTEILNHMDGHEPPFHDGVLVLQGNRFRATGKVDSRRVPLHPGPTPAIRLIEPPSGKFYSSNLEVVENALADGPWVTLDYPDGIERGLIRVEPLTMLEVAEFLESLRYSSYDPAPLHELSQRWISLQRALSLPSPLFRPPGHKPGPMIVDPSGCPYTVAAYLRLWNEALSRHDMPGMQPTDEPSMPWNLINLAAYRAAAPKFYMGLRFGSEGPTTHLQYRGRTFQMMRRSLAPRRPFLLETLWGSRNPTERWFGDQAFDYHYHNPVNAPRLLDEGAWRTRGQPGLILIHPVADPVTNRETIAIGLAIPHGGPDHVAALRGRG